MATPTRIGVVGCGYWGPNLIRNFRGLAGCKLSVVCDLDIKRLKHLQSLYPDLEITQNFDDLVGRRNLDAIVVATPVPWHHGMAKASLIAGKHTFVEKPMAASAAQCEELMALANARRLVLMAGYTFLFSPAVRKIKEIINAGDIGEIRYISARRLNLGLYQQDINVTWDLAPHDVSIVLDIMEESPVSVNCRGSAHITPGVEDVSSLCLTFRRERSAIIQSSWLDPRKVREMTIVGSRRMIVYDDVAPLEKIRIFDARVERPPHYDTFAEFHYSYHHGDVYAPFVRQEEPLKIECQHFIDCIQTGLRPLTGAPEALAIARVLEASSTSLRLNGAAVHLNGHNLGASATVPQKPDGSDSRAELSRTNGRTSRRERAMAIATA